MSETPHFTTIAAAAMPLQTEVSSLELAVMIGLSAVFLLTLSGAFAAVLKARSESSAVLGHLREVNRHLAEARAADEGWDRDSLYAAAREAAKQQGLADSASLGLMLVEVDDQPGTDADKAVFTADDRGQEVEIVLVRQGNAWS